MNEYLTKTDTFMASLGLATYRVGGSVRDELLGRPSGDADYVVRGISLDALADELMRDACRCSISPLRLRDGQQGGWRVRVWKVGVIEVMLPRTDVSTGPRHSDFKLVIDPNLPLEVDAQRRDFTFNALYVPVGMDGNGYAIDPLGCGIDDLLHRRINVTHPDSFRDDPLRIMRALRFISTLGYELGPDTRATMAVHADAMPGLTAAGHTSGTLFSELCKLLMGAYPARALRVARDTGVLAVAFPELAAMLGFEQQSRYHDMTTDEHVFTALETAAAVDAPLRVRLALLYHDAGKPDTAWVGEDGRRHYYKQFKELTRASIMHAPGTARVNEDHEVVGERLWRKAADRMNVPKDLREDVAVLIREHMVPCQKVSPTKVCRARVKLGDRLLESLYMMRMCDLSGKGSKNMKFMENVGRMEAIRRAAATAHVPTSVKDLEVGGLDAVERGIEGRDIGRVLRVLLDEVVVDPTTQKLTREWQLGALGRLANHG